jgi:hypothetical protein
LQLNFKNANIPPMTKEAEPKGTLGPREAGRQFALVPEVRPGILITPINEVASDAILKIHEFREGMKSSGIDFSQRSNQTINDAVTNARLLSSISPYVSRFFYRVRDADLHWEGTGADGKPRQLRFGYSNGQQFGEDVLGSGEVGLWFQRRTYPTQYVLATPDWVRKHGDDPYKKSTIQSLGRYGQAITLNQLEATIRPYSLKR